MGKKVFVSYKYKDEQVANLKDYFYEDIDGKMTLNNRKTRVRDYVDFLQNKIGKEHINLGERDGESLDEFSDQKIETLLKNRIRQCSVTIVLISKGMKDPSILENDQWIPWEVSYSLRVVPTGGNTKQRNAVLGVVLPDETESYDWYYRNNPDCNCVTHFYGQLFKILGDNMFNILEKDIRVCNSTQILKNDEPSFIKTVKWHEFIIENDFDYYINKAIEIKDNSKLYDVHINLD